MMSGGSAKVDGSDMVQGDDAVMMCKDDAVGGILQQSDEYDNNGSMMCEDGATNGKVQHIDDDVFIYTENVIASDDRDCEGVVDSCNMNTNISMRNSKSRTSMREAGGHVGVGEVLIGTVWVVGWSEWDNQCESDTRGVATQIPFKQEIKLKDEPNLLTNVRRKGGHVGV